MRLITFLNELSHPSDDLTDEQAKASVTTLIKVLREIKKIRPSLELHSALPLPSINIGNQRTLASLRSDGNTREEWQFLRGLENRAFDLSSDFSDLSTEYEYAGNRCLGLGFAHAFDSLAVSFGSPDWKESIVQLQCHELNTDAELATSEVFVRHAASDTHLEELDAWLKTMPHRIATDGQDLWDNRLEYFPALCLLPRTEEQLVSLKSGAATLNPINFRLWQLQCAAQDWNPDSPLPVFLSKVTPEYEKRRNLCYFDSQSSGEQLFDLHARYTPGAGRIHFWCNTRNRTIEIAHIGEKL